jgi:pyruvate kinase
VARRVAPDRRTKIVATIGPASDDPSTLAAMAQVGMNVARVPLAHGTTHDALARIERVRAAVPHVGILADLPGPKIRSVPFPAAGVNLETGTVLELFTASNHDECSSYRIGVNDPDLVPQLSPGDRVAIGDGGIALDVVATGDDGRVTAEVHRRTSTRWRRRSCGRRATSRRCARSRARTPR